MTTMTSETTSETGATDATNATTPALIVRPGDAAFDVAERLGCQQMADLGDGTSSFIVKGKMVKKIDANANMPGGPQVTLARTEA